MASLTLWPLAPWHAAQTVAALALPASISAACANGAMARTTDNPRIFFMGLLLCTRTQGYTSNPARTMPPSATTPEDASPPRPFRAMAMARLHDRIVSRIREPTKQLPGARIALASLEDSAEPVRRAASHGDFGVRMKARNRASAFLRVRVEQRVRP